MSNSQSEEESEEKSTSFTNQARESDNDSLSNRKVIYEIIVAGGEDKKSVEHILLPATLQTPKERNVWTRLRSAVLPRKSSYSLQKWSYLKSMTTRRQLFMTGIYKDQMFAFGGMGSGQSLESLDLNDPRAVWKYSGQLFQQDFWNSAAVVYGESAYIFGGTLDKTQSSNIYRVGLAPPHAVEMIGQMPEPRSYHSAEIFGDKVIILCGSSRDCFTDVEWLHSVLQYDITTSSFKTLPPLPVEITFAATAKWKDNVVIVGGVSKGFDNDPVWLYNVSSGETQRLPPMIQGRVECAAVVAGDMLVVLGGRDARTVANASVECYNFMTNKWTELLPPMRQERRLCSAVVRCWDAEKALAYKAPRLDEKSCRQSNPELVW